MLRGEFPVSFGLTVATKDARLSQAALRDVGVADRLDSAVLETMEAAAASLPDPGAVDLSALIAGLTPGRR
jgi:3-hydroxyisobutyrate dehydrogenase